MAGYNIIKPESISLTDDLTGNIKRLRLHGDHLLFENLVGTLINRIDNIEIGLYANRRSPGIINSWYYANDIDILYLDDGTNWNTIGQISPTSKVRVNRSGSDQIVAAGATNRVEFNTKDYDIDNEFDIVTEHRFTVKASGYYLIRSNVYISLGGADIYANLYIYKNGTMVTLFEAESTQSGALTLNIADQLNLSINDYIDIYISHNSASNAYIKYGAHKTYFTSLLVF